MILKTLYKRTRTGAIQQWTIFAENGVITKEAGQLGGKITMHKESCKPKNAGKKNATTAWQQAELQAQSDWKKKRDEGYKSLDDLGINGEENLYSFDTLITPNLIDILQITLPEFNTDSNGQIKPMLAPADPWKPGKTTYPQRIETKFDGVRTLCIINVDKSDSKQMSISFLSRSGKNYTTLGHIVHHILRSWITNINETLILDGEIYCHGMTLEEINEAVKKERPETAKLEFWIYDLPLHPGIQEERSATVESICQIINSPFIKAVSGHIVYNDDQVKQLHDSWVEAGFEGAMLKDPTGKYQPSQRSRFWQKVKMFDDNEFEIIGAELGLRGTEDLIFICKSDKAIPDYDPAFKVYMNGTRERKAQLYADYKAGKVVGKKLTVKHFSYTKYGIPFLPKGKAIRED